MLCFLVIAAVLACALETGSFFVDGLAGPINGGKNQHWRDVLSDPSIPPYELDALRDLYDSTNGPHWQWDSRFLDLGIPWNFTGNPNPCDPAWQGIACSTLPTDGYFHIVGMNLRKHNLTGQLPPSLFNLTQLTNIILAVNRLTGTIPAAIRQLTLCVEVDFSRNSFSGTLPEEIGFLKSAEIVDFEGNQLYGTLPAGTGDISTLVIFRCSVNHLTGTLPSELGSLRSLFQLSLEGNNIQGTIPQSYGQLRNLTNLYLSRNQLTGTFPSVLLQLPRLLALDLGGNQLSGTLPDSIGQLPILQQVFVGSNRLTGTLSNTLLQLPNLKNVYLFNNLLSGSIPDEFSASSKLSVFELSANNLSGPLPVTIAALNRIIEINLRYNFLTGTIPEALGDLVKLHGLEISENSITGTIPSTLGQLRNVSNIYLNDNFLHGTLPDTMGQLNLAAYLYIHHNLLSGTLPVVLSQLPLLVTFLAQENILSGSIAGVFDGALQPRLGLIKLSGNEFTGPIPLMLFHLPGLVTIFLDGNQFTGSLQGVFNASRQQMVETVQFSNNQLTGTIPDELFALSGLKTAVLGSNCFSGSLPLSACSRHTLTTLSLDGLRSASSCQRVILPGLSSAYLSEDNTPGGLPNCLLQMPNLVALHLSGNGLTGTIPGNANLSSALVDLSLSHNRLTGSIPRYIQRRTWYNLDLSYNKFKGDLTRDFASIAGNFTYLERLQNTTRLSDADMSTRAALSLRNNRLSRLVPSEIKSMHNVSVLSGNLFSCHLDESDLPPHDSGKATYQCGSTSFDIPYYLWLSAATAIILVVSAAYFWRQRFDSLVGNTISTFQRWLSVVARYEQENPQDVRRLLHYKYVIRVRETVCEIAMGSTAFIVAIFLPLYAILSDQYGTHSYAYAYTVSAAFLSGPVPLAVLLTFFLCLVAYLAWLVTTRLRALHEMEERSQEASRDLAKAEPTCPTFEKATIYGVFFTINFAVVLGANIAYVYVVIYEDSSYNTIAQIALSLFKLLWNNAGVLHLLRWTRRCITCSAPQGVDDSNDSVSGFFGIQLFVSLFNFIAIPCLVVGTVSPSCFNNLLVKASPVETSFFYEECIFYSNGLFCELSAPRSSSTSYSPPFTYSYQCSSSLITYYAPSFIYMALIVTFVNPALKAALLWAYQRRTRGTWLASVLENSTPLVLREPGASYGATDASVTAGEVPQRVVDGHRSLVILCTNVGVLLTFGLVFPPIAVAMLVAVNVTMYVRKIEVGRFLTNAIDQNLHKYLDAINSECRGVGDTVKLRRAALMLLAFMCFFYAPFLFDTLGDRAGAEKTAWVVVVLAALPAAVHFSTAAYTAHTARPRAVQEKERDDNPSVEMRESSATHSVDRPVVSALHA